MDAMEATTRNNVRFLQSPAFIHKVACMRPKLEISHHQVSDINLTFARRTDSPVHAINKIQIQVLDPMLIKRLVEVDSHL